MSDATLFIGHGSRDAAGISEFLQVVHEAAAKGGLPGANAAFLELAPPSIEEAVTQLAGAGVRRVRSLPLFLFYGRHVLYDIPRILAEAGKENGVEILYGEPLAEHPKILDLAERRIREDLISEPDALLVIGRGTLEPRAIRGTELFASALGERFSLPTEHCFVEVTGPSIEEGFTRLAKRGCSNVLAFPSLLFTGVVLERMKKKVAALKSGGITLAGYLGPEPEVIDAALDQLTRCRPL